MALSTIRVRARSSSRVEAARADAQDGVDGRQGGHPIGAQRCRQRSAVHGPGRADPAHAGAVTLVEGRAGEPTAYGTLRRAQRQQTQASELHLRDSQKTRPR